MCLRRGSRFPCEAFLPHTAVSADTHLSRYPQPQPCLQGPCLSEPDPGAPGLLLLSSPAACLPALRGRMKPVVHQPCC